MGAIGPIHLIFLLIAVSVIAATCGYVTSVVTRRNKRYTRVSFVLGFGCGLISSAVLRARRPSLNAFAASRVG